VYEMTVCVIQQYTGPVDVQWFFFICVALLVLRVL